MKIFISSIVLLVNNFISYSQQAIPQTLVYKDSIPYFYAWKDSVIQTQYDVFTKTTYVSVNGRITDTIETYHGYLSKNISANDKKRKDIVYAGEDIYKLSIETGKIDTILQKNEHEEFESYYVAKDNQLIGSIDMLDTSHACHIISYDIKNKRKKVLHKMNNDDNDYVIWKIESNTAGLSLVHFGDAEAQIMMCYTYDAKNNSLVQKDYSEHINPSKLCDNFTFSHDDISGNYMIYSDYWVDTLFDVVQPTLRRSINECRGFKLKDTDTYYYLASETDEAPRKNGSANVWLACRFTLAFDMFLYKIYNNESLTEIEKLGEWELHKLKNMVFAKHNYKFESSYLQAFYNLFSFYKVRDKKNRITDVNHLLTPTDRKNLELIRQISKTKEKKQMQSHF